MAVKSMFSTFWICQTKKIVFVGFPNKEEQQVKALKFFILNNLVSLKLFLENVIF